MMCMYTFLICLLFSLYQLSPKEIILAWKKYHDTYQIVIYTLCHLSLAQYSSVMQQTL